MMDNREWFKDLDRARERARVVASMVRRQYVVRYDDGEYRVMNQYAAEAALRSSSITLRDVVYVTDGSDR